MNPRRPLPVPVGVRQWVIQAVRITVQTLRVDQVNAHQRRIDAREPTLGATEVARPVVIESRLGVPLFSGKMLSHVIRQPVALTYCPSARAVAHLLPERQV